MAGDGTSRTEVPTDHDDHDDRDNNLMVAEALLALLRPGMVTGDTGRALTAVEVVVDERGYPTNQIDIGLSFMRSPYRITVERVTDGDVAG